MKKKYLKEQNVLKISMFAGIAFVLVEFIMAIISKSQAVLMDSVYDGSELIMIIISIRLIPLLYKPISEKRPYGYGQVESIFILVKSFMILAVTIGLVLNNLQLLLSGGHQVSYGIVAYFELTATIISVFVIILMKRSNGVLNSPLINTEIGGWVIDAVSSLGMTIAFFMPLLFHGPWITAIIPYLDQLVAISLALFVLPYPIKIILTSFRDMFLFAPELATMNLIKETCQDILDEHELNQVVFDVIRTGRKLWISIYFRPNQETLSVALLTNIQGQLRKSLKTEFDDISVELLPDISEADENLKAILK